MEINFDFHLGKYERDIIIYLKIITSCSIYNSTY